MSLNVLTLNAQNGFDLSRGFAEESAPRQLIDFTVGLDVDIATFPEAYDIEGGGLHPLVEEAFDDHDYAIFHNLNKSDDRKDRYGMLTAVKHDRLVSSTNTYIYGGRVAMHTLLVDGDTQVQHLGVYGDQQSAEARKTQFKQWQELFRKHDAQAPYYVLAGSHNELHMEDRIAHVLRTRRVQDIAAHLPLNEHRSKAVRLANMGSGEAVKYLEKHGLRDADTEHAGTYPARAPFAQIARIMISKKLAVIGKPTVHSALAMTDHRPVSARLRVTKS